MNMKREHKLHCILAIILTSIGVYICFRFLLPLVLPFIIAYLLAWIIRPSTEFLYKRLRIPRIIGGTLSLITLMGLLGTGFYFLVNTIIKQGLAFLRNMPIYMSAIQSRLDRWCDIGDQYFKMELGTLRRIVDDSLLELVNSIKNTVMPGITQVTINIAILIFGGVGILLIILVSAVLIVQDLPKLREKYNNKVIYKDLRKVTDRLTDAGIAYIRTQLIIMCIVAFILVLGLSIIGNDYALLLGVGIAIMDALPILGSGLILVPWSIIMLLNENITAAAILITVFLLCQITREILEPKLLGNRIGIKPLYTLISIYVGLQLFSIAGFILGPIGLIIIVTIVKIVAEKACGCEDDIDFEDNNYKRNIQNIENVDIGENKKDNKKDNEGNIS